MLDTKSKCSNWMIFFLVTFFLAATVALSSSQTELKRHSLAKVDDAYVDGTGELTRCGPYFVLETRKYGEHEVKQLHVCYEISEGRVAVASKDYRDVEVVVDDSKATPTLILKQENPGLEKNRLELSSASYDEAKSCVPPTKPDGAT